MAVKDVLTIILILKTDQFCVSSNFKLDMFLYVELVIMPSELEYCHDYQKQYSQHYVVLVIISCCKNIICRACAFNVADVGILKVPTPIS